MALALVDQVLNIIRDISSHPHRFLVFGHEALESMELIYGILQALLQGFPDN